MEQKRYGCWLRAFLSRRPCCVCMYLRDGAVTAIVLTGGYYYCSYTFFFIHTSILRAPFLPAMIQQVPRRSAEVSPRAPSRSCLAVPRGTRCGCPRGRGLPRLRSTRPAQALYRRIRIQDYICRAPAGGRAASASSLPDAPSETPSPAQAHQVAPWQAEKRCDSGGHQRPNSW